MASEAGVGSGVGVCGGEVCGKHLEMSTWLTALKFCSQFRFIKKLWHLLCKTRVHDVLQFVICELRTKIMNNF